MKSSAWVVTRDEAERIFARLEPALRLTAWGFYTLPLGVPAPGGWTTLYTVDDLALGRLFGRLRHTEGLPTWLARGLLTYRQDDIRRVLRSGAKFKLAIQSSGRGAFKAAVLPAAAATDARIVVSLDGLLTGLDAEMRKVRMSEPSIWTGARHEDARAVSSSLVTQVLTV